MENTNRDTAKKTKLYILQFAVSVNWVKLNDSNKLKLTYSLITETEQNVFNLHLKTIPIYKLIHCIGVFM